MGNNKTEQDTNEPMTELTITSDSETGNVLIEVSAEFRYMDAKELYNLLKNPETAVHVMKTFLYDPDAGLVPAMRDILDFDD